MSLLHRHLRPSFKYCLSYQLRRQQTQVKIKELAPTLTNGPVFKNALNFPDKVALRDNIASYTYANLLISASELAKEISHLINGKTDERILFLCPNDANYVITLWAIWMSGQIAVPLSPLHPKNSLLYFANDTNSKLLITTSRYAELMQTVAKNASCRLHVLDDKLKLNATQLCAVNATDLESTTGQPQEFYNRSNAMILYTSGTTGNPKGVLLSHNNLNAQVSSLIDAWRWSPNDVILHTLPLHHVHGIVNALLCPLHIGAKTIMLQKFNANTVWSYLLGVGAKPDERKISLYMAVPTIYSKLIDEYEKVFKKDAKMVDYIKNTLKTKLRLMVSGSAPLPVPVYEKWLQLSGQKLLERYGMTEIGMCLSNEYDSDREPGYVGVPLPGVSVRLAHEGDTLLEATNLNGTIKFNKQAKGNQNISGDLLVKSDGCCKAYYERPQATAKEFTADGWFKTGDISEYDVEKKKFKILGRSSVDIIKSGGYKISALEIETKLLAHPDVKDCVILGVPDEQWGEIVAAIIVKRNEDLSDESLSKWLETKMPKYALPRVFKFVADVPKNAMGKVNKKELLKSIFVER